MTLSDRSDLLEEDLDGRTHLLQGPDLLGEEDLYGRTDRPTFSRALRSEAFSLPSRVTLRSSSSLSCCSCWAEPWASSPASFCRFSAWGTVGTPSTSTMTGRSDRF